MTRFSRLCRSAGLLLLTTGGWLFPSQVHAADNPAFSGSSLRLVKAAAVACFEARIAHEHQQGNLQYSQTIYDFSIGMEPTTALDYQPALDSAEGFFFICRAEEPTVWGAVLKMFSSLCSEETPAIDKDAVASTRPLDIVEQLAIDCAKQLTRSSLCGTHESAINFRGGFRPYVFRYAPSNELVAPHTIRVERIGVDFDFTIAAEEIQTPPVELPIFAFTTVTSAYPVEPWSAQIASTEASRKLLSIVSPTPCVQHHIGSDGLERIGIDFEITPRIIITEEEEESLLGCAISPAARLVAAAQATVVAPQCQMTVECKSLEIQIQPLVEPALLAVNDAAPLENPDADFIQLLPPGDDAPVVNPELETSAARVVSPTMSPDEYLAAFSHRIIEQQESHGLVIPVAHEEPIKTEIPSPLQALGDQVTICDSHAPTCHGFTIQFAPQLQPAPVAEAQAFDGPAQITLHDGLQTPGQGFVWPAQPAAHTESLDELADRLERDFLQRAVSGQIQVPAECSASDQAVVCKEAAACKSGICSPCQPASSTCQTEKCPAEKCQPCLGSANTCKPSECQPSQCQSGAFGLAECIGCPAGSPCGECCTTPSVAKSAAFPAFPPRSHWTLPTPAMIINQYAADPRACGIPSTFATPSQVGMPQQHAGSVWTPAPNCPAPAVCHVPPTLTPPAPNKTPVSGEALETHREISRTLEQLAERCESQGLYTQADELRTQAQEFRMRARVIHGHLAALPLPPPSFGQMTHPAYGPMLQPMYGQLAPSAYGQVPYAVPPMYVPESAPSLTPPAPLVPASYPQPLPIAQPMLVPRY
jgi:hypothetical protein